MSEVCIITGVGPGTGSALVRRFAAEGYQVAMIARDEQRLMISNLLLKAPEVIRAMFLMKTR